MTFLTAPKAARPLVLWEHRVYPGSLAQLARVRADLSRDLAGFDGNLVETVRLCASGLFANSVEYTDSGGRDGEVVRALSMPDAGTLRFSVSDCGGGGGVPAVPDERTEDEWSRAEGQRGLLLVENLSRRWGHFRLAPWADLGTHVWATFDVEAGAAPPDPRPYVFTSATV
ncbi:histidine kinase [Nocardiopsis sp. TSRI0078]|uniref:ATP-binding protein n=1 Tax=unclassified Nocardiopsis TaxID=2649073 RepID=UPI00093DB200|nr:ATP-binding protein [Nocardiopsis sp. TSRI0078]OKI13611.1 histidine kinase [Nocardiopsis sp. TSRI0078]